MAITPEHTKMVATLLFEAISCNHNLAADVLDKMAAMARKASRTHIADGLDTSGANWADVAIRMSDLANNIRDI